ncbi:MAG: aldo/keto reductase [Anaerovoracaceae bacterium]
MIYRDFKGLKLSGLGLGCMRLPVIGGDDSKINEEEALDMIDYAYNHGINYFDTAWGYHDGNSELVVGKGLSKYPRDSFFLADKFPGYDLANMPKVKEIFEQQLVKCRVDYFDFYLVHNVCEMNINQYLDPKYGILDYLKQQLENGRIKHLGFSIHGNFDTYTRFMEVYGPYMEFCQIQLNWFDWTFQDAKRKIEDLGKRGIPVWVMEPLRGGKLLDLSDEEKKILNACEPDFSPAEWGFRFLQAVPGVTMVLSGMTHKDQLIDNINIWNTDKPLNEKDWDAIQSVAAERIKVGSIPCTACHYCTSHCPQGLDIPWLIELYNQRMTVEHDFISVMALQALPDDKKPSACLHCHSCEKVCPQQLKISDIMADFDASLHHKKDSESADA